MDGARSGELARSCLRLGANGQIAVNHGATGKSKVRGLALEQELLLGRAGVSTIQAVFHGDDAGAALAGAATGFKLPHERVNVHFCR